MRTQKHQIAALMASALSITALTAAGCGKKEGGDTAQKEGGGGKPGAAAPQNAANAPTPVRVVPAREETVTRSTPVTGSVAALQSVTLSPKVAGRIDTVAGREGEAVRAGQVVIQQDTDDYQQQLNQARANLQAARVRLTQAQTNYQLQLTQSQTNVKNAQAQLSAAEANLALAKNPQRSEEITKAQIAVQQAQANFDRAAADTKRYAFLVKEGAAAQATLDQYVTQEAVQKANLESAKQNLKIAQTGGRQESVLASQEQVRQARIGLQQARANVAQNQAKLDDVRAAQAAVGQNQALVNLALQQIAVTSIKSPINGLISDRTTEPGQQAAPGANLMTIVSLKTVYFEAQVPETSLNTVRQGSPVEVKVDAYPTRSFRGTVSRIFPTGSASSRTFNVRVDVPNSGNLLKPGMFARGNVIVERRRGTVIPKDALIAANSEGTTFQVFVAKNNGQAEQRPVKIGITTATTAEILSGVRPGDQVIIAGQDGLKNGSPIQIEGSNSKSDSPVTPPQQAALLAR